MGRNALANLIGRAWIALMSFAFVPVYIRLLGMEAYGLIGFFAALMGAFAVLDLGLGITVNRELSRLSVREGQEDQARDLLRTFEAAYWLVAATIGTGTALAAPLLVDRWLHLEAMPRGEAVLAVRLMGIVALLRWPVSLYIGALLGMQRQVQLNLVTALAATAGGAGAVAVLAWVAPALPLFFGWQALVAAVQVLALRGVVWRALGRASADRRPRVALARLRDNWRFSAGMTGIALLSVILTQLDKFVLSRMLPLGVFGYYALAGAVAGVLANAGTAIETAAFPALARHVAAGDAAAERRLYHAASQGLALLIMPATVTLALFSRELLTLYTHDPVVAARTHAVLSLLAAGNGVLALMFMPLSLQLANGWTRLSLLKNIAAVAVYIPLLWFLAHRFGAIGAASTWLLLTLSYLFIEVPVMHRRLLHGSQWAWYGRDIGVPLLVSVALLGGLRLVMPATVGAIAAGVMIAATAFVALVGSAAMLPSTRRFVMARLGLRGAYPAGNSRTITKAVK